MADNADSVDIAPVRLAATVMIVRDDPFEVLMVKRNARPPFASALVFPGGVVDPEDYSDLWLPQVPEDHALGLQDRALRVAACREAWEETSILPGSPRGLDAAHIGAQASFLQSVQRANLQLSLNELVLFSHWITPEMAAKRFDTYFFLCRAPAGQAARCDGLEILELEWMQPQEGLARAARGDSSILLPTEKNLQLLAESRDSESALAAARGREVRPIMPRPIPGSGGFTFSAS